MLVFLAYHKDAIIRLFQPRNQMWKFLLQRHCFSLDDRIFQVSLYEKQGNNYCNDRFSIQRRRNGFSSDLFGISENLNIDFRADKEPLHCKQLNVWYLFKLRILARKILGKWLVYMENTAAQLDWKHQSIHRIETNVLYEDSWNLNVSEVMKRAVYSETSCV